MSELKNHWEGPFKVGDIVRLKSGSPQLTVQAIDFISENQANISVVWFVNSEVHRDVFTELELVKT